MVPDKFNMVDMGGIDLIMMQGEEVPGLYNRLVESITQCRYQCLYNWLFDGVIIPPTYVELEVNENDEVAINEGVTVSEDDVMHIYSLELPAEIIPLLAEENGVYNVPAGKAGFNPVAVDVPSYTPVINPISITENGIYTATSGVDGYSPITVNVSSTSENDFLFHFDDGLENEGKLQCVCINNSAGNISISDTQKKFGTHSLRVTQPSGILSFRTDLNFDLGANDFTLDFWMYPTNLSGSAIVPFCFNYRSLGIYLKVSSISLDLAKSSSSWSHEVTVPMTLVNNIWYHVAITRSGNVFYLFVNGEKVITIDFGADPLAKINGFTIGNNGNDASFRFNGYIDELRMLIGRAVWTDDFTPPTEPYV